MSAPRRVDYLDPQRRQSQRNASTVRQRRNRTPREHGWSRSEDKRSEATPAAGSGPKARSASGLPLLLCVGLGILTFVGAARVRARLDVLEIADDISVLTGERDELLDRKRRLEAERAYLRRPERVRERATQELGMVPAGPERIQSIRLLSDNSGDKSGNKPSEGQVQP